MIAFKFQSVKNFMTQLLLSDSFDHFLFIEGKIVTFNTFSIDGFIQKSFFDPEEKLPQYSSWGYIREYCYSIIKGKRTPLSFKFIFALAPKNIEKLVTQYKLDFAPEQIQGLYLNIRYENGTLQCVTGTSLNIFTLDRSLEKTWDAMIQSFFDNKQITYTVME